MKTPCADATKIVQQMKYSLHFIFASKQKSDVTFGEFHTKVKQQQKGLVVLVEKGDCFVSDKNTPVASTDGVNMWV